VARERAPVAASREDGAVGGATRRRGRGLRFGGEGCGKRMRVTPSP
jgi:hypothetical protein